MREVVIVGAGLAGLRAAEELRYRGFEGRLTIVGAETRRPYNRPPLSKQFLAGQLDEAGCGFSHDVDAEWVLGTEATGLDLKRHTVSLEGADALSFDGLIVATGSRARPWPGPLPELDGFMRLRDLDDATRLRDALSDDPRVVILGAGFVGCEVTATLRRREARVTLVDVAPHPMTALGETLGRFFAGVHAAHGVTLRLGASVTGFHGRGRVEAVELAGGERLEADLVLVATGAQPNVEWLRGSGLRLSSGVRCDATLAALGSDRIFAAGDVAEWPHPIADDEPIRVEHWDNACDQGRLAAANLLAPANERAAFDAVPSFWTHQYDLKVQAVGLPTYAERLFVAEGALDERHFVAVGERAGRVVAAIACNRALRVPWYSGQVAERLPVAALPA